MIADLESLPRSNIGPDGFKMTAEQKTMRDQSIAWWKEQPIHDRPTKKDVVDLWRKHGLMVPYTTAYGWFASGRTG